MKGVTPITLAQDFWHHLPQVEEPWTIPGTLCTMARSLTDGTLLRTDWNKFPGMLCHLQAGVGAAHHKAYFGLNATKWRRNAGVTWCLFSCSSSSGTLGWHGLLSSQYFLTQLHWFQGSPFHTEEQHFLPAVRRCSCKKPQQDFTLQNENFHCFILDCSCLQKYSCEYTNVPIEAKYFCFLIFNKLSQDS